MKKPRIEGKRRHVYFYVCVGTCAKKRATFDHERAAKGECVNCENMRLVAEHQSSLFEGDNRAPE